MPKLFVTTLKRIVQEVAGGAASWTAQQLVGLAVTARASGTPELHEAAVGLEVAARWLTDARIEQTPALDLDVTADGTAATVEQAAGLAVEARAEGTPSVPELAAGATVESLWLQLARIAQSPALALSTLVDATLARVDAAAGVAVTAPRSATLAAAQQLPAMELVRIVYDLTHRKGADSAANDGPDNWTNPNNATGSANGTTATSAGEVASARTRVLRLGYTDMQSKTALTISAVRLHFYVEQAGTNLNNGDLRLRYNVGAGAVTLETITGNVANLVTPRTHDLTSAVGGDWAKIDALQSYVEHRTDIGEALITAAVDAVELEVVASATQSL